MKNNLIFFILFVLFATSVYSAPPQNPTLQTDAGTGTLTITYPQSTYYEMGTAIDLDFHVFNSTGQIMANNKVNCTIHLYNTTGDHTIIRNLTYIPDDKEYNTILNTTLTSEHGNIPYIVWCFSNSEGGFISSSIFVGMNTDIYETKETYVPVTYLLILIIFIYLFVAVTWKLEEKTSIVKLFLYLYVVWLVPLIVELMNRMAVLSQFSAEKLILITTLYTTTMWINITFTFIVGIFLFYNLLKLLGVDIVKSFRRGGR